MMMHKAIDWQTATGHEVLVAAGKTILRPGGRAATARLLRRANFQPGETILELASGLGQSAIALAKNYGVFVVGIERDADRVAIAQAQVRAAGLADQVQILQGDIFHLEGISQQFDYVLAEAILTMQSPGGKAKMLQGVGERLKPGGWFLSHELQVTDRADAIHKALASVLRVNASPLSRENWVAAIASTPLTIQYTDVGKMNLLNLFHIIQDEGILNTLRIMRNVIMNSQLRSRVLAMNKIFRQYRDHLGYIIIAAQKEG
jgi:cyclopropane fatty-acyl-phospholipid synthase-like methyltransferase